MATATLTPVISPCGYQAVGLSAAKTLSSSTGLSTTTQYYFKITKDGSALTELDITTTGTVTYAVVIPQLNAAIAANATLAGAYFGLNAAGDLCCYSNRSGASSSIGLAAGSTGTDMFATLTSWVSNGFESPVKGAPPYPDETERFVTYYGSMKASDLADTYATGGLVTSFAGIFPSAQNAPPLWVDVQSLGPCSTASTLSNVYRFVPGTTIANGVTKIFTTNGAATGIQALQELTNGTAMNATTNYINRDRVVFKATWRKGA